MVPNCPLGRWKGPKAIPVWTGTMTGPPVSTGGTTESGGGTTESGGGGVTVSTGGVVESLGGGGLSEETSESPWLHALHERATRRSSGPLSGIARRARARPRVDQASTGEFAMDEEDTVAPIQQVGPYSTPVRMHADPALGSSAISFTGGRCQEADRKVVSFHLLTSNVSHSCRSTAARLRSIGISR